MFQFSKLSSATKMALVALSFAGIAIALGLPLYAAAGRVIPEVVPVVGKTADPVGSTPEPNEPEAPPPEVSEPEVSEPETSESSGSMTADEIKAAVQALLDAENAKNEPSRPETSAPQPSRPDDTLAQQAAEQAAAEQAAKEAQQKADEQAALQAALDAQKAAQSQAEQQAAQQQAEQAAAERAAAQQAARGTPFPFDASQFSPDKGGYYDKTDGSRTLVAAAFPTGSYISSQQIQYQWMGEAFPAVQYVAENGMVVTEIIFF